MPITVEQINDTTFEVTIEGRTPTSHTVTVSEEYWRKLTGGNGEPRSLVEKSFEFLLEREPNTSILNRFDLPLIQRYFPEYESAMREQFR